ncbi:MAG: hypothetical protein ACRDHO_07635 [Actinomycetota bacterium]
MIADASAAARAAAVAAAFGFVLVGGFQVALALGAPWGRAAWGGTHDRLTSGLRIASVFAAAFWIAAALVILVVVGYEPIPLHFTVAAWVSWVLFGILALGALMNLASKSRWERFLMSPVALVLSLLCLVVALDGGS